MSGRPEAKSPQIDVYSRTWREIETWANEKLEQSRSRLETHRMSMEETEFERGRVDVLRDLLFLAQNREPVKVVDASSAF